MKKSIELFSALKIADLEEYKAAESCPADITVFITQLLKDFELIAPPDSDPVKLANNVLEALFKVAKMHPDLFNHIQEDLVAKTELIYDIYPDKTGIGMNRLNELVSGIQTIDKQGMQAVKGYLIKQHMSNIVSILKQKKPNRTALVQAYTDLGGFLRAAFPEMLVPEIKENLEDFSYDKNQGIPHLELYSAIVYAAPRVYDHVADAEIIDDVFFMGSLTRGIEVFAHLEKIGRQVDQIELNESEIKNASDIISYLLPTQVKARADETLVQYEKSCSAYLSYLHRIINTKASESIISEYNNSKTLEELDVAANTIRAHFKKQPQKLAAFEKYRVMKEAQTILMSDDFPVQRVEKFKTHLLQNKPTLTKRRDSFFMTFVKGLGVFGATLVGLQRFACHSLFGENATRGGKMLKDVVEGTPNKRFKYHG